jgi:hypothetical protein
MRFVSRIDVFLPADVIERAPTVWDRLRAMWQSVDLETQRARDKIEAATFVYEFRNALYAMGIDNARSLVVDDVTVFHDAHDEKGDLPDLVLALSEHVSVFGESCRELRLSVEHEEAGMDLVVDATIASEHRRDAASARIAVLGQLAELDPRRGETAEEYRARIDPFVSDPKRAATVRLQFAAFIARLEGALRRVFTETRFVVTTEALDVAMLVADAPPIALEEKAPREAVDTAAPQRNFTLSVEQRIAALMSGPPPYAVRLRKIEDLEAELVRTLAERDAQTIPIAVARGIEELNRLIADHNRYYPVECNLPMDAASGQLMEMGEPWKPRPSTTIDGLWKLARARRRP